MVKGPEFERLAAVVQQKLDPGATVEWNKKIVGRSGEERQIDVAVYGRRGSASIFVAVEAKDYADKVGIGLVDEFVGKLHDVRANAGIMVTATGYTDPALARAAEHGIETCLLRRATPEDWAAEHRINAIEIDFEVGGVLCHHAELIFEDGTTMVVEQPATEWLYDESNQWFVFDELFADVVFDEKYEGRRVSARPKRPLWRAGVEGAKQKVVELRAFAGAGPALSVMTRRLELPENMVFVRLTPDGPVEGREFFIDTDLQEHAARIAEAANKRR